MLCHRGVGHMLGYRGVGDPWGVRMLDTAPWLVCMTDSWGQKGLYVIGSLGLRVTGS